MDAKSIKLAFPLLVMLQSCASLSNQRDRMLIGAGTGAALGGGGGALLSPNDESRGLNALVFGLSGALIGGVVGYITASGEVPKVESKTLEEKELGSQSSSKEYVVQSSEEIPSFLKNRMTPAVIEEFVEKDTVGEDGTLHEPHKVYRIKRPAELISKPEKQGGGSQ